MVEDINCYQIANVEILRWHSTWVIDVVKGPQLLCEGCTIEYNGKLVSNIEVFLVKLQILLPMNETWV